MFNWFKSKIELKNEKIIMSSLDNKKGVKMGSDIVVPEHFECLIYNNGKHYNTLQSGKYRIDKADFSALINAEQKLKNKLKHVKFVAHYVCINSQQITLKIKKQKYLVDFKISNTLKFAEFMLLYAYKVDNDYTVQTLNDMFVELFGYNKYNYKQIPQNALEDYGLTINNISLEGKVSILSTDTSKSLFDARDALLQSKMPHTKDEQNDLKTDSNTSHKANNLSSIQSVSNENTNIGTTSSTKVANSSNTQSTSSTQNFSVCTKCGHSVKFKTTYCLRCGYKLEE